MMNEKTNTDNLNTETINNKFAIILLKDELIVQVRLFNRKQEEVVNHAKAFNNSKNNWYDKVIVVRTVDHMKDLMKNKQKKGK